MLMNDTTLKLIMTFQKLILQFPLVLSVLCGTKLTTSLLTRLNNCSTVTQIHESYVKAFIICSECTTASLKNQ